LQSTRFLCRLYFKALTTFFFSTHKKKTCESLQLQSKTSEKEIPGLQCLVRFEKTKNKKKDSHESVISSQMFGLVLFEW